MNGITAIYIDLLFTKELRESCDQVFLLTERNNNTVITDVKAMLSDVNCKMYQLGNNTQKLSYKHIFTSAADKIDKKSTSTAQNNPPGVGDLTYLKVLCKGRNSTGAPLEIGDAKIKLRVKFYNKYRDMKVITAPLN